MRKAAIIVGARPNFIKVAPLLKEINKEKRIRPVLIHTGQHYDYEMSKVFFRELKIPRPEYNLEVGSASFFLQVKRIIKKINPVLKKEKPDILVVFGDVNSALAASLAAFKKGIPVAHVESGLRSFNVNMQEEVNRMLIDSLSSFLFCPSETAVKNLKKEGIINNVYNTGDLMRDIFKFELKSTKPDILKKMGAMPKKYFLLTIHRAENADNPDNLKRIIKALARSGGNFIFPVHPRTLKQLKRLKLKPRNIRIIKPVSYREMICLEKNSIKILTDSGGIVREAFWLNVPCITLREEVEWTETLKGKNNILAGSDEKKIIEALNNSDFSKTDSDCYGKGDASEKIVKIISNFLSI